MLIYAAGVEMLAGDFVMDPEMRQLSVWKQGLGLVSLILGAIAMGVVSMCVYPFPLAFGPLADGRLDCVVCRWS